MRSSGKLKWHNPVYVSLMVRKAQGDSDEMQNMVRLCAMRGAQSGGIFAIMDSEKNVRE